MAGTERLVFDILATGNASDQFLKTGKAAEHAGVDVSGLQRKLEELARRSYEARLGLKGDKEALAALDRVDAKLLTLGRRSESAKIGISGAARATAEVSALDVALDKVGKKGGSAETAAGGLSAVAGGGGIPGGGMGALIGAGVILSPVLVTLGTGLAGFGAAAYGSLSPVLKASQATGGLQKNMHLLNPEQQALARSLHGLGQQYDSFQKQLQPEVMTAFGTGIKIAGTLMHDTAPVAAAFGKALDQSLSGLGTDLRGAQWQDFFKWMAANVPTDMRLVTGALSNLGNSLPALLEELNPVAQAFLGVTDAATGLIRISANAGQGLNFSGKAAGQASGPMGWLARNSHEVLINLETFGGQAAVQAAGGLTRFGKAGSGPASKGMTAIAQAAAPAITAVDLLNTALLDLNGLLSNQSAQVSWKQAQIAATKAIAAGSKAINGNSSAQLANRAKVVQSTQSALTFASQELKTAGGTNTAARALQNQITFLERAHDKSAWMRTELGLLRAALLAIKSEKVAIRVSGQGSYTIQSGSIPGTSVHRTGAAAGWRVPGFGGGDRWPAMLEGGESVVPKHLTPAVAPFLSAHGVPGFAAGVVGSYSGTVPGLTGWVGRENTATIRAMSAAVEAAFKAGASSFAAAGTAGGPGGGAPSANAALARHMYPAYSSGPVWDAWNYVAMRESGWNQFARNPSSGAYGIAQALPPTKYPFAGQAAGGSNPAAQIGWMWNYMAGSYGGPIGAADHERAFNWYGSGLDAVIRSPTLIGVGERGPEHVRVTPGGGSGPAHVVLTVKSGGSGQTDYDRFLFNAIERGMRTGALTITPGS
jgi:hypothetical protein